MDRIVIFGGETSLAFGLVRALLQQYIGLESIYVVHSEHIAETRKIENEKITYLQIANWEDDSVRDILSPTDVMYVCNLFTVKPTFWEKCTPTQAKQMLRIAKFLVGLCAEYQIKFIYVSTSLTKTCCGRYSERTLTEEPQELPSDAPIQLQVLFRIELEVWRAMNEGLCVVILYPTLTIVPSGKLDSTTCILSSLKQQTKQQFGTYGFVHMEDLVHCMIRCVGSEFDGESFFVSAENHALKDILSHITSPSEIFSKAKKEILAFADRSYFFDNSKLLNYAKDFTYKPIL